MNQHLCGGYRFSTHSWVIPRDVDVVGFQITYQAIAPELMQINVKWCFSGHSADVPYVYHRLKNKIAIFSLWKLCLATAIHNFQKKKSHPWNLNADQPINSKFESIKMIKPLFDNYFISVRGASFAVRIWRL